MWSTALDSKTCETCAPLDQMRWDQGDNSRPDWPIHPNCRCESLLLTRRMSSGTRRNGLRSKCDQPQSACWIRTLANGKQ